ncbi:phospholipase A [Halomonas sp. YLGW01]|uniref:phospholipase A n=1 Tax=Halomonas sp. YLGW01 TaxID=2773308 RepID=UPI00177B7E83|nr:phospholipase A [Halomonas sp. YLGW01]
MAMPKPKLTSLAAITLALCGQMLTGAAIAQDGETEEQATHQPLTQEAMADELAAQRALEEAEQRRELEAESENNPFAITAYRRNYLFPWSYNSTPDEDNFRPISESEVGNAEVKFQFSAKFKLADNLFVNNGDLYFAYTQRSWWQAYNSEASSPFRETNFEPEFFLSFDNDLSMMGWTNIQNRLVFNHQSNGRSEPLSRSWNRLYAESVFQRGDWVISLAPHWRIPESEEEDDNPDIERYMGYGDITLARRLKENHEVSLLVRGNPGAGHMGYQFDYSLPLSSSMRWHIQYYHGYGESLVGYDTSNNRLSLGFSLNSFFTNTR